MGTSPAPFYQDNILNYWWVNQNQTFRQETEGGYLWSPKRNANGGRNPFYEFMRAVIPGDLVFSFQGTFIRAIGLVQSFAYAMPKPSEFGNAGANWNKTGWCVDVKYHHLDHQIRPTDHMGSLSPLLPLRYSPLQQSGRGNQGVYLTRVSERLAYQLVSLIGEEAVNLRNAVNRVNEPGLVEDVPKNSGLDLWEEKQIRAVLEDNSISSTEKDSVIIARRGQGVFKERVHLIERRCRITKVDRIQHLVASHIKPWRQCEDSTERLDGSNGLLLTPNIDHLFDRGFISFDDKGVLMISPVAHLDSMVKMGIDPAYNGSTGVLSSEQKEYMGYHRDEVFLSAAVNL